MNFRQALLEAITEKLIQLTEEDSMDNAKGDLIRRIHAQRKFKKAIGNNTRKSTLGSKSQGPEESQARMSATNKKSKAMPLDVKTKSKRGAKVRGVRGKSINTSRSTGREGAVANANEKAFNKLMASLARRGEG